MKNTIGRPVKGADFFDRVAERVRVWEALGSDNILLLAPRRVGKTSLLWRLVEEAEAREYSALYEDVSGLASELGLVERVYHAFAKQPDASGLLTWLQKGRLKKLFESIKSLNVAGVEVVFQDRQPSEWRSLGEGLFEAVAKLGSPRKRLVIIDELPIFVMTLLRQDPSGSRARDFLEWFRRIRQGSPETAEGTRWIVAGSIGLGTVTRRYGMGDTIADLRIMELDAFDRETAAGMLRELAHQYKLHLASDVIDAMLDKVGRLIPFDLQLLFSAVREVCELTRRTPSLAVVDEAHAVLLSPSRRPYFDFWAQRLVEVLGPPLDGSALRLLTLCAKDPTGASRSTLLRAIKAPSDSSSADRKDFDWIIDVLISDGYIIESNKRYRFRSNLLRDYWLARRPK